jgi:methionyl-tRNA synthetase
MSDAPQTSQPASPAPQAPAPGTATITFDDFAKIDLRIARVLEAREHPNADKLLVLKIDLGTEQRQLVAGIRGYYQPADLVGRLIVVVRNLAPRKMRGEESQGMLLAASTDDRSQVILLSPSADIAPGSKVS